MILILVIKINKHRKSKSIWFNRPFCKLFNINEGKCFFEFIDKHFNMDKPLNKIYYKNTQRICCPCTNNISNIVYNQNKNLVDKSLIDNQRTNKLLSNCSNKEDCLIRGMGNSEKVVYQATIFPMETVYIEISFGNWKQRFYNHRHSFFQLRSQTALSKWFGSLRARGLTPLLTRHWHKGLSAR